VRPLRRWKSEERPEVFLHLPMASLKAWWRWMVRQLRSIAGRKPSSESARAPEDSEMQARPSKASAVVGRLRQRLTSKTPASERPATWDDYASAYAQGRIEVSDPPEPPITISLPPPDTQGPPVPPKDDEHVYNPYTRGCWPAPAPQNEKKRLLTTRVSPTGLCSLPPRAAHPKLGLAARRSFWPVRSSTRARHQRHPAARPYPPRSRRGRTQWPRAGTGAGREAQLCSTPIAERAWHIRRVARRTPGVQTHCTPCPQDI
jgi:hypothetical protein